ncbi:fungal Zn binuclear cluster domain containing protein [Phlyctema vagabunda]|uniref:Fungal Zn binuclear cluster domain containing protein n=1 Tax=Phlyctema vagabunda TaxID=108571 RepID=A0ABR4PLJ6_9HELO
MAEGLDLVSLMLQEPINNQQVLDSHYLPQPRTHQSIPVIELSAAYPSYSNPEESTTNLSTSLADACLLFQHDDSIIDSHLPTQFRLPELSLCSVQPNDPDFVDSAIAAADTYNVPSPNSVSTPNSPAIHKIESKALAYVSARPRHKNLGRQRKLAPGERKHAHAVRKKGACWPCWILKRTCSEVDICTRCTSLPRSSLDQAGCNRTHIVNYTDLFFPELLVMHLEEHAVQNFTQEHVSAFANDELWVRLSWSPAHSELVLPVSSFLPMGWHRNQTDDLDSDSNHSALPVALKSHSTAFARRICQQHIQDIVTEGLQDSESMLRDSSKISAKILNFINRYHKPDQAQEGGSLLHQALSLYAMHSFMGASLFIKPEELMCSKVDPGHSWNTVHDNQRPSALLIRQVKYVMNGLLQKTTNAVLEELEKQLRLRSRVAWASSFCVIVLLCMCTEALQVAVDGIIIHKNSKQRSPISMDRVYGISISRKLEDLLYTDCSTIFHGIYKNFNPIKDGVEADKHDDLDQASQDLIKQIRQIMSDHEDDMIQRAKNPMFRSGGDIRHVLEDHMTFRNKNSGRLVSQFLRSFLVTA